MVIDGRETLLDELNSMDVEDSRLMETAKSKTQPDVLGVTRRRELKSKRLIKIFFFL